MKSSRVKGLRGESLATGYLKRIGYKILEKNFTTTIGEIDIIARTGHIIAFIEVKSRMNLNYGMPYEAVNERKQKKIIKTALCYIKFKHLTEFQFRFDIIEVYLKTKTINHIENAFLCEDI